MSWKNPHNSDPISRELYSYISNKRKYQRRRLAWRASNSLWYTRFFITYNFVFMISNGVVALTKIVNGDWWAILHIGLMLYFMIFLAGSIIKYKHLKGV